MWIPILIYRATVLLDGERKGITNTLIQDITVLFKAQYVGVHESHLLSINYVVFYKYAMPISNLYLT